MPNNCKIEFYVILKGHMTCYENTENRGVQHVGSEMVSQRSSVKN